MEKTILALRLLADLLATSTPADRVPVVFNLSTWDPTTTPLPAWLAARLTEDHPGLAAPSPTGATLAVALLTDDRVLPVLDGFDEIASGLRAAALRALNHTTIPMVLTSRPEEYHTAVAAADVLTAAAVVTLADLSITDLTNYLTRASPPTHRSGTRWAPVLASLTAQPPTSTAITVATALATPLMVYLARTVYSDTPHRDPAELLDPARFPTAEAIEDHLLDAFIPAVYQQPHSIQTGHRRRRSWDAIDARRWHGYLATHLHRLDTHDLAWWQLRDTIPRTVRVLAVTLAGGLTGGLASGLTVMLTGALATGRTIGPARGLAFGLAGGLAGGFMVGLAVGFKTKGSQPQRTQFRRSRIPALFKRLMVGLAVGFMVGLAVGLAAGLEVGLTAGLAVGLVNGLAYGLAYGLAGELAVGLDVDTVFSPIDFIRIDRSRTTILIVVIGLAVGLAGGLAGGLVFGPAVGLAEGFPGGLSVGLGYGLAFTAWGNWLIITRLWLPATGKLPWPVVTFLADAHQRGILRQAGGVYQYRHARLRDRLAIRTPSRGLCWPFSKMQ